jgi:hypothetical protein
MSLEPARLNFSVWKGATFQKRLTYHQGGSTSTPVDLTGYSAELKVIDGTGSTLLTLTNSSGIVLGGTSGTIDLIVTDEATSAFSWRTGNYKLSLTTSDGRKDYLLFGNFSVKG